MDEATRGVGGSLVADAAARSAERLAGAASLISMLEEKAETGGVVAAAELAAVRCVIEACVDELDAAWSGE